MVLSNFSNIRNAMVRKVQFCGGRIATAALLTLFLGCGERNETPPSAQPISSRPAPVAVAVREPRTQPVEPPPDLSAKIGSKLPIYEIQIKREDLSAMDRNFYGPELYP